MNSNSRVKKKSPIINRFLTVNLKRPVLSFIKNTFAIGLKILRCLIVPRRFTKCYNFNTAGKLKLKHQQYTFNNGECGVQSLRYTWEFFFSAKYADGSVSNSALKYLEKDLGLLNPTS
jgi:hypothetical protein